MCSFALRYGTNRSLLNVERNNITFNDLPQVVAQLRDEVMGMKAILSDLQKGQTRQPRDSQRDTLTPEQVSAYIQIPLGTIYQKLANGTIPSIKAGKRYVIYLDELEKWLETMRKTPAPKTDDEINASIMAGHRRKPRNGCQLEVSTSESDGI